MADLTPLRKIFAPKNPQNDRPQAGTRFGLSWPLLAALCLVLVSAVAWSFFMGYMVGKGEHPAESLSAMTGMKQAPQGEEAPVFVESASEAVPEPAPQVDPAKVLAPPTGAAAAAWPEAARPAQKAQENKPKPANKSEPGVKYNYTFQVAAIRGQAEAEKMRAKLAAQKLRVSLRKSGKVHLVMVNLRGDANDVERMKEKLKAAHLGKPLQISRKPVGQEKRRK